jgi:hypothetical protein
MSRKESVPPIIALVHVSSFVPTFASGFIRRVVANDNAGGARLRYSGVLM